MIPTRNFTADIAKLLDHLSTRAAEHELSRYPLPMKEKKPERTKNAQFVVEIREGNIDSSMLRHVSEDKKEPVLLDHPVFSRSSWTNGHPPCIEEKREQVLAGWGMFRI